MYCGVSHYQFVPPSASVSGRMRAVRFLCGSDVARNFLSGSVLCRGGGTMMYAMFALAGDVGCSAGLQLWDWFTECSGFHEDRNSGCSHIPGCFVPCHAWTAEELCKGKGSGYFRSKLKKPGIAPATGYLQKARNRPGNEGFSGSRV